MHLAIQPSCWPKASAEEVSARRARGRGLKPPRRASRRGVESGFLAHGIG
ncbi:MAG: hypothetical protein ACK56I_15365 [bacterium]